MWQICLIVHGNAANARRIVPTILASEGRRTNFELSGRCMTCFMISVVKSERYSIAMDRGAAATYKILSQVTHSVRSLTPVLARYIGGFHTC